MIWNKRKKEIEKLKEQLRISDRESQNKIEKLVRQLDEKESKIVTLIINQSNFDIKYKTLYDETLDKIKRLQNSNDKLSKDLRDIIESESTKPEPKVEVNYVTSELQSITIKDECYFNPLTDESEIEAIHGLMIKLLPYINNSKILAHAANEDETIPPTGTKITNQLTILTNK